MRDGDRPVLDAAVRVRVEPLAGAGAAAEVDARREADPLGVRYRANVPLGADGPWRVTVAVTGPDGHATAAFPIDVGAASWPWWPTALGSAAALAAGLLWGARRRRTALPAAILVTLAILAGSTTAGAHASLVRSSPARRATLTTPPDRVQLWFNEAVEPRFSTVSVWSAAGQQVDLADARVEPEDPKRLAVGVGTLGPGTYRVKFRVLSVDGHVVESEFTFTIR
jgi:methionine-rich copper-binding protein CopC